MNREISSLQLKMLENVVCNNFEWFILLADHLFITFYTYQALFCQEKCWRMSSATICWRMSSATICWRMSSATILNMNNFISRCFVYKCWRMSSATILNMNHFVSRSFFFFIIIIIIFFINVSNTYKHWPKNVQSWTLINIGYSYKSPQTATAHQGLSRYSSDCGF